MAKAVALKLQSQSALAVVVRTGGSGVEVEAVVPVTFVPGDNAKSMGEKIAAALKPFGAAKATTVLAVPRADLHWANYDLPPAPPEELPNLVAIQGMRDFAIADDGLGFDYVSLDGDHEHPHRVLAVGLGANALERARNVCAAADLKLTRIVPEPFGWVELGRLAARSADAGAAALAVFSAMAGRQAAVWATAGDELRLVRTVWLAAEPNAEEDLAALAGELRRTLLSLSQHGGLAAGAIPLMYCGDDATQIAGQLSATLSRPVRGVALEELVETPTTDAAEVAPLAALAAAAANGRKSPVDLLNPHRPPAPPSRKRTFVLAGAAAGLVAMLLAWNGYRRISTPLAEAAAATAKQTELAPTLTRLADEEKKAAAVDAWLGQSVNLLTEFDHLGKQLRPKELSDKEFNSGEDLLVTKLSLAGRQLTLEGAARSTDAVQAIERRLRDGRYRVMRGVVELKSEGTPGYEVRISEVVERMPDAEPGSAAAASAPVVKSPSAAAEPTTTSASPASASASTTTTPNTTTPTATNPSASTPGAGEAAPAPSEAAPGAIAAPSVVEPASGPAVEYPAAGSQPVMAPVQSAPAASPGAYADPGSAYAPAAEAPAAATEGSP
jgi:hypothetical protein